MDICRRIYGELVEPEPLSEEETSGDSPTLRIWPNWCWEDPSHPEFDELL